jgi:hypothetical protein
MRRLYLTLGILTLLFSVGAAILLPIPRSIAQAGVTWVGLFFQPPVGNNDCTAQGTSSIPVIYNGLNKNWGTGAPTDTNGSPIPGMPADCFSAIFTASSVNFAPGLYEFIILADDGVRLRINSDIVIDDYGITGLRERSVIVNILGGLYTITLEYVEYSDNAVIQVNWVPSDGTPRATITPPPTHIANVVQVRGLAVRTGPFLGGSLIAVARPEVQYPVLARNTQEGLFTWYYIQYDVDTFGWSSGRYLTFSVGDPATLPLENSTHFDITYDPPGDVIGVTRSVMNFRVHPTQRSPRVAAVPQLFWGAEVEILARTVQGGRDFWYQVRYTPEKSATSYIGWIFAPYVGIKAGSAPIDSIPVI